MRRENECKENGEKRNNVNSFNKIIKLRVTDDIEYKIVINKTIMSFMDKRFTPKYKTISDGAEMIRNNQFSLLKDKIKINCRYLQFHDKRYSQFYDKIGCEIEVLINYLKQSKFFRNHLFEYRNRGVIISLIISKNLQVYQLFIEEFNHIPTVEDLKIATSFGANKFIRYLLEKSQLEQPKFER
ncbi:hypothetical protein ACTFIT_000555 [Dictyostelium discoideum]